jgi:hypothetical protein
MYFKLQKVKQPMNKSSTSHHHHDIEKQISVFEKQEKTTFFFKGKVKLPLCLTN